MAEAKPSVQELLAEIAGLRQRLEEAEETLRAIRNGEVDALLISTPAGEKVYTLKGADHSYRILVETINEGAATLAPDGDILYANTKLAQILRLPLERVIGSAIGDYISDQDRDRFRALIVSDRENPEAGEFTFKAGDGAQVPVYLSISSLQIEETPALCMAVIDLTQQKRDEALVAEGRLSREILLQAEQAIVVCDEAGKIIHASRGAHLLCEQNPLYLSFPQAFPLRCQSHEPFSLDPVLQGTSLYNEEVHLLRWDGKQLYLVVNAGPLLDENQNIQGCVAAFTDITERKRADRERQKLIEQLQQSREELTAANEELMVQAEELQVQGEELRQSHGYLEERVAERTAELAAANKRLKFLTGQLLSAQERERKRISMELHDDLGQSLILLKMQLHGLMDRLEVEMPRERDACKASLELTTETIEKVRRLSQELSPAILDDVGLPGALDHLFHQFSRYSGIKVSAKHADIGDQFPMEAQIGIYRIFQEVLNNILKHSGARKVKVDIKKRRNGVEFSIEDNGQGFDPEEVSNRASSVRGAGLITMDERVNHLGAELQITSYKGGGTKVAFRLPFGNRKAD